MRPCQTILASFNSHQSDASLVAKENRQELLQAIFGQLARIPCKTVGVQALVEVLHSSYHVNLDSGGGNDDPRHRGSTPWLKHRSDIEISRAITTEILAATESALVALSSQNRDNSSPEETAISESEESDSAEQMSLKSLLSNTVYKVEFW
eukprot:scpid107299/ scgid29715/ 